MADMRPVLTFIGALCAVLVSGGAVAGYANASPPPGWTAGVGTERAMFRAAANEAWQPDRTVRTTATLNVGGRTVSMPAGMRMAANAGRYAARFAWGGPLSMAAMIAIPLAMDYFSGQGFMWDANEEKWKKAVDGMECTSGCLEYQVSGTAWDLTKTSACQRYAAAGNPTLTYTVMSVTTPDPGSYPAGQCNVKVGYPDGQTANTIWMLQQRARAPYDTRTYGPATQAEMEASSENKPMPTDLPNQLPRTIEWPVEAPVLNPSPLFVPETLRVPVGEPYPVPNTNPQKYTQPVVDVKPAPTTLEPWRVDARPVDMESEDPTGVTEPESVPQGGTTTAVLTPKGEPAPGLCEQFPDILACQKLGTPGEPEPIKTQDVAVSMTPDSGWGLGANACPAARSVVLGGGSYEFSFQALCDFASGIRPVIVGMAYLSALLAFFGFARRAT